ncbi:hypothetical protein [Microbacterium sp. YY-01]|uniref:hypothetical protein n=1 Tax=Microbacterium sp. YY-01 TaxID=3421634 RepID=UPI003D1815E7
MSASYFKFRTDFWPNELGLAVADRFPLSPNMGMAVAKAVAAFLTKHPPVAFKGDAEGETLTFDELRDRLQSVSKETETTLKRKEESRPADERAAGWKLVEEALSAPDATDVVPDGPWAGFTRGDAQAWCWNLFHYEPTGFVHPNSQVRAEALQELRAGSLPAVFGYPQRARELVSFGLTPRSYREQVEQPHAPDFKRPALKFN